MPTEATHRPRCYRCWRPAAMCLCPSLPRVETRTALHILQHPRERTHPFGTARLLALALPRARLHVAYGGLSGDLLCPIGLPPDAAVLYPHADAVDLAALPPAERPTTLLLLDGTWAHARRLYLQNPWLRQLRHVRLHPDAPSRYRIRSEPQPDYVSTVEAAVAALRILEPDTPGLDGLLAAFEGMVDRQLLHLDAVPQHGRSKQPRNRQSRRLPALLGTANLLVVYGESALAGGVVGAARALLQWTAARVDSGEVFEALVRPAGAGPSADHLRHLGITAAELDGGLTLAEARRRFLTFAGAEAALAAWTPSTLGYGEVLCEPRWPRATLKIAVSNLRNQPAGVLDEVVARQRLAAPPLACRGRAAQRLGNVLAVARWLRRQRAAETGGS